MRGKFDIIVVGGGASGIAAAVSAARIGSKTLLIDKFSAAGGTGGFSGLTTLCGLFYDNGNYLNDGFAREFAELLAESTPIKMGRLWVLPYRPEKFRDLAMKFVIEQPTLTGLWNTPLADIIVENGKIVSVNGIEVSAVID